MSRLVQGVFIVGTKRTPFGTFGGKLVNSSIAELQTVAAKAALTSANVPLEAVDSVIIGNVLTTGYKYILILIFITNGYLSTQEINTGASNIVLTGGVENMSAMPYAIRNARFGVPLGVSPVLEDTLWVGLTDTYCKLPMALTAEKLGEQYKITRDEVDEFSLRSQQLWKQAQDAGRFKEEIVPIPVKVKKDTVNFEIDEHPRPQTTIEGLKKLPTLFKKNGVVTAGSASGVCDGAAAVVLASEEAATKHNLKPLARILGYSVVGVEPSIMGIGPAPAIRNLLKVTGKSLNDIDLIEINEAFGAQTLACAKELNLDLSILNVDGGAIALGHPLGASGSRITGHLVNELRRRKAKLGIGSACIGGGQGIAVMVEAL
ncbi:3-ketoacyl-CoA thiolase, mitochondrial [Anoplophora glabripennis]|uniref:3-ketoacyl-CoA thiolase, mitochondrial n=1 Tax=Anoplophora glabripennis TaxID=217634 RepID=UPI000C764C9A|nr:3-ketoacyl-CoA thiolase, mitochondrial [Anoplophora glabripennis]